MYKYSNSQLPATFNNYLKLITLLMFIHITQDKSKLDNLLYQKHVQTQVLKMIKYSGIEIYFLSPKILRR